MNRRDIAFIVSVLVGALLAAAGLAAVTRAQPPAADEPAPVVTVKADVTPGRLPIPRGTPLKLRLETRFESVPPGGVFVLQHADYLFGAGARFNGGVFPSCSAAKLRRAHGVLRACPKGSKVGEGTATGTAVDLGITATGKLTVFNGPGGKSFVLNFSLARPVLINRTFSARLTPLHGKYLFKLSAAIPRTLQRIVGSDIVVSRFVVTTGRTWVIDGRRRGYFEALTCPPKGSIVHGDFSFRGDLKASAETTVVC